MDKNGNKQPLKKRRHRLKIVNFDHLYKKLTAVLEREINQLLTISQTQKLDKDESTSLVNYMKLFKTLEKREEEEADELTDEQLEKIAESKTNKQ